MASKKPDKTKKLKKINAPSASVKADKKAPSKGLATAAKKPAAKTPGPIERAKAKVRQALEKVVAKKPVVASKSPLKATKTATPAKSAAPAKAVAAKIKKTDLIAPKKAAPAPAKPAKIKTVAPAPAVTAKKTKSAAAAPAGASTKSNKAADVEIQSPTAKAPSGKATKAAAPTGKKGTEKHLRADGKEGKRLNGSGIKDRSRCREPGCDLESVLSGYCRLHYIKNWRRIKKKEAIMSTGQLDVYVEELVAKYPDKYLDAIENDLASEKEWSKVVADLELGAGEEEFVPEEDEAPLTEATGRRGGAGFDDDSEDIF